MCKHDRLWCSKIERVAFLPPKPTPALTLALGHAGCHGAAAKLGLVANTLAAAVAYNVRKSVIHDLNIGIINHNTGELLRQLTLNPDRDYQPQPKN